MQAGFVPMLVVGSLGCSRCKSRCGCVLTVWYRNGSSFGTRGSAVSGGGRRGGAGQGRAGFFCSEGQSQSQSQRRAKMGGNHGPPPPPPPPPASRPVASGMPLPVSAVRGSLLQFPHVAAHREKADQGQKGASSGPVKRGPPGIARHAT
jgi:hypothetical protein